MNTLANIFKKIHQPQFIFPIFILILIGPFLLAYFWVQKPIETFHLKNHGQLISPTQNIEKILFYDLKGKSFAGGDLTGKWWLMYVAPVKCQQTCHDIVYNMRQIRTALGRESSRLERLFVAHPACPTSLCEQYLTENYPDMRKVQIDKADFARLFSQLGQPADQAMLGELYIIDPKGNIMMRYSADIEARAILSDIKHLLKVSKIG